MIDKSVIEAAGLTQERLKQIFTAEPPMSSDGTGKVGQPNQKPAFGEEGATTDPASAVATFPEKPEDWQIRQFFEDRIQARMDEGIERSLQTYRMYQAVDIAMDGTLINQAQLPLQLMAQGYIDFKACAKEVRALSPELASELFNFDAKGEVIKFNAPRLFEVSHNLVHSLTSRRVGSVSTPIRQRHPFMKFDARDTSPVGRLKSELFTQYAEIMADNYGYRPEVEQVARAVSCYGHHIEFAAAPWDSQTQKLKVRKPKTGADDVGDESLNYETKEVVVKEGLPFVGPHPRQVYWDTSRPLAHINFDMGPSYIGYWDMRRIGEIRTDPSFWNRDQIEWDGGTFELLANNSSFFDFYYREQIAVASDGSARPGLKNDRTVNIAEMSQAPDDTPVTFGYHYEKINPKQWGIADYDHDVWIRFIVVGNRTVVWADVYAATPAIYYGYNESNNRTLSPSFASLVIPYQDQISNLLSQLLEIQHQGLMRLYTLNVDGMTKEEIDKVETALMARQYTQAKSIILKVSAEAMRNMGVDPGRQHAERIRLAEVSTTEKTSEIFRSIMNLLSMAERLLFFSPQELGQVSPRTVSATEANIVNNTTLGIRDFHAIGIEEGLDAKKRVIYESAVAFGSDEIELPCINTYNRATVEAAGFQIVGVDSEAPYEKVQTGRFTVTGNLSDLVHNYVFTSRDGTERTPSAAVAQASVQLLEVIGKYPQLGQAMEIEQGVEIVNGVARSLGLPVTLRVPQGMDPKAPMSGNPQEQFQQFAQGVQEALQAIAGQLQKQQADQVALAGEIEKLAQIVQRKATPQGAVSDTIPSGAPPIPSTQPESPFLPVG